VGVRRWLAIFVLGLLLAAAGCGSDDDSSDDAASSDTAPATTTGAAETGSADLTSYKGIYVAQLDKAELAQAAGPKAGFPGGTWRMSIAGTEANNIRLEPGDFDLQAVAISGDEITFAPDLSCETAQGRTEQSVFRIEKTSTGLRFTAVKPSCKSDAAALTLAEWRGV